MRVVEASSKGGPEVLRLVERAIPQTRPGEVLVKVAASGVNRPDLLQRQGKYPPPPGASDIIGLEVSGTIVDGDTTHPDNCFGLTQGSPVCALLAGGGYAEYAAVPLKQCLPVPKGLTMVQAACLPETYFTVWSNVFDRGGLGSTARGKQETLLVQGGASGIGTTAIQLAHAMGHTVYATAGADDKCAACVGLGAARAINYKKEDFAAVCMEATGGRGVDVVLDMVAGDYVQRELSCLADDGRICLIAFQGGATSTIDVASLMRRRHTLTGSTLRARDSVFKGAIAHKLHEHVWPLLENGYVKPIIHAVFPAADVVKAHAELEAGQHIGKVVLTWE